LARALAAVEPGTSTVVMTASLVACMFRVGALAVIFKAKLSDGKPVRVVRFPFIKAATITSLPTGSVAKVIWKVNLFGHLADSSARSAVTDERSRRHINDVSLVKTATEKRLSPDKKFVTTCNAWVLLAGSKELTAVSFGRRMASLSRLINPK
jgi:hypothetical protein